MYSQNLKQNIKNTTKFFLVFMFISVSAFGNIPLPFFQSNGQLTFESRVPTAYAAGPTFTLSGILYSDTGSTPLTGSSYTVKAAIGTSTPTIYSTTTVSGTGAFRFDLPTSTAPTTWTLASSTEQNDWVGVAFGNGRFVSVSNTGTNIVMYSADGASWTAVNPGISISPSTIIFANGRFDVFGGGTTKHMYSKDGINWTTGTLASGRGKVIYAEEDNKYLALSTNGTNNYSYDGETWFDGVDMTSVTLNDIAYGEGKFRAAIQGGTFSSGRIVGSLTGVQTGNWSSTAPPSAYGYESIAYGNGYFVAVTNDTGSISNKIIYTADGGSWSVATAPGGGDLNYDTVDFVNGYFVAIAHEATTTTESMAVSPDGITWQEVVLPELSNWQNVVYGNGRAVAVSSNGTSSVMYSDMGIGLDTPITLWVDADATVKATTFMKGASGSTAVTGVPLYQNNLVTFNATTDGDVSRTNLSDSVFYDSSDDSDILYTTILGTGSTTASSTADFYMGQGFTLLDHTFAVAGDFNAANSLRTGLGTVIFNGTAQQTATGTMTGDDTDSLYNLTINNTSEDGATNRSVVFSSAVTATGTFAMIPGASVSLASGATSTFTNVDWQGTSGSPVWIYSSAAGTQSHLVASGTIDYVNIKDSDACGSPGGGLTTANGTDYGNNTCWTGLTTNDTILISGTLYSDAGTTPVTSGPTIKIAIGTSTPVTSTTTADGSGAYSFVVDQNELAIDMPITVFVDASTTLRATVVTKIDSTTNNIAGLNLYQDRVIVRQEGSTSTSLVELAAYDSTNDADVQFTASSTIDSLNILNGQTLHIWTGDTFVAAASTTLSGSYENNGTYTHNNGVLNLTGTSTTLTGTLTGTSALGNVIVSGDYEFLTAAEVRDFTISSGATTTASTTLTITGNYTNNGVFEAGNYTVVFGGSSLQTATGTLTGASQFYNLTISNTAGNGTTTQSVTFGNDLTATGTMTMQASTSVAFKANATSSFNNIIWSGTSTTTAPVWVYSSVAGSEWYLQVDGTATIDDAYIKDSNTCASTGGGLTAYSSIDVADNTCWTFLVAPSVYLSGRLYSDEGTTAITSGKTIKLAIGQDTPTIYSEVADGSGDYTFIVVQSLLTSTSTKLSMWVDGDGSVKASLVSRLASTTADISDLDLYQNHVIVRHEGDGVEYTLTTADMEFYDGIDDSDIQFTASSSATTSTALSVNAGHELYIWPGKNLAPLGGVVIHGNAGSGTDGSLELASGAGYFGQWQSLSLAGDLTLSTSSVFRTHASGTIFTATTTGKTIVAHVASTTNQDIGNVEFNGVGGGWTFTDKATTSNFTITNGTFAINSGAVLAITEDFINNGTFSNSGDLYIGPSEGWNFMYAVHDANSQDVSGDEAATRGIFFKPDGTKMYIVGITGDEINEYTLATPWDVSSRGAATAKNILSETTNGWKIRFTPDGKLLYIVEDNSDLVYRYQLSTPWSVATAVPKTPNVSFISETAFIEDLEFSNDGATAYILSESNQSIYSYTLAIPWDLTTKTYSGRQFSVVTQDSSNQAIEFNAEGTKLYIIGNQGDDVIEYDLSIPWLVASSSVSFNNEFFTVSNQLSVPRDMFINPNGTRMYILGNNSIVYTYNLAESTQQLSGTLVGSSALGDVEIRSEALVVFRDNASTTDFTLSAGTSTLPAQLSVAGNLTNNASLRNGGGEVYLTGTTKTISGNLTGVNKLFNLTVAGSYTASNNASTTDLTITASGSFTAPAILTVTGDYTNGGTFTNNGNLVVGPGEGFAISTALYDGVTGQSVSGVETAPRGFTFNEDGTKLYVIGSGVNDEVNQYNLTTPWDVTTKAYYDVYDTTGVGNWSIALTPDGRTLYAGTQSTVVIYKHRLTTPWDLTTASYTGVSYTPSQNTLLYDITFSSDGTKVYLPESSGNVHTYALANPWDISDASVSYVGQYDTVDQVGELNSIAFNTAGTQAYVVGQTGDDVDVYDLLTPWNFSTSSLSYVGALLNVGAQEDNTRDMHMSTDGLKIIIIGNTANLNTYNIDNSAQTIAGTLIGSAALGDVTIANNATTTFANNASTTDLTILNGTTSAPILLSVSGNYTNNSVFDANSGKVFLSGTSQQTATGSLSGTSAFADLTISNTSQNGSTNQSVVFGAAASTTGTFTMLPDTSAAFTASAGYTFQNVDWDGTSASTPIYLRSTSAGSQWQLDILGSQLNVEYVNVKDSDATQTSGGVTAGHSTDGGSNTNWNFGGITTWNATDWTLYDTITIDATNVDADLTDFPVYVDLADLSATFWSTTPSAATYTGTDIRVTTDDGSPVELARELVFASSTAQTGELHFKANSISSTTDTVFRIYYNGTTTGDYATSSTYGAQNVWTNDYRAVWHFQENLTGVYDEVLDSTVNGYHGSSSAMDNSDVVAGKLGGNSYSFGNTTNEFIDMGDPADGGLDFGSGQQYTISMWGASPDPAADMYPFSKRTNSGYQFLYSDTFDLLRFRADASGTIVQVDTTGSTVLDDTWRYYAGMRTDTRIELYINTASTSVDDPTSGGDLSNDVSLTIGGITSNASWGGEIDEFRMASTSRSGAWLKAEYYNQATTTDFYTVNLLLATGSSTIADHDATQVSNAFDFQNKTDTTLFAFKLTPESGDATTTSLVVSLSGAKKIDVNDFSNIRLYRDVNNDTLYDGGDVQVGGSGVMVLNESAGSITFSSDFSITAAANYIVVADWNAPDNGSFLTMSLPTSGVDVIDDTGAQTIYGSVDYIQHSRNNRGGGGSSAPIGGAPPAGAGQQSGGSQGGGGEIDTNTGGDTIGNSPGFLWPTANSGSWTNAANAYDQTDGTYAVDNTGVTNNFSTHNFSIPGSNVINGVEVKMEISGTTAAGTIDVDLSWDGGTSWTSAKSTPTLTTTDSAVSLGGSSDKWGRTSWIVSDFSDVNFVVRLTGNPSSNTVQVDAIQVRVYHQAGGGGGGGGGAI